MDTTKEQFYLCHCCCDKGTREAVRWLEDNNKEKRFTRKNIFQVKAEKLDEKYGFKLDSLYKQSYLCDGEKILVTF